MSIFIRLVDYKSADEKEQGFFNLKNRYETRQQDFKKIPGSPIAYWASENILKCFVNLNPVSAILEFRKGMGTGDNESFVRCWYEVSRNKIGLSINNSDEAIKSKCKWFPYNNGGLYRKWYGNNDDVVNWYNDGVEVKANAVKLNNGGHWSRYLIGVSRFFQSGLTWTAISSSKFGVRLYPSGFLFSSAGMCAFGDEADITNVSALMNSKLISILLAILSPTLNSGPRQVEKIPFPNRCSTNINKNVKNLATITKSDWDSSETSWDFTQPPLLLVCSDHGIVDMGHWAVGSEEGKYVELSTTHYPLPTNISDSYSRYRSHCRQMVSQTKQLEEENNRIFIEAYGLQDELTPDVPIEEITLFANPHYRYKGDPTDDEREARFKEDTMKELISYVVGCMMGRYSLDVPGLVYAHAGNKEFDIKKYETFPADEDGIIPITEREWFEDDAACRFFRFIETAWDKKGLDANLDFIADAIGRKAGESSREVIRRYFADGFFKDHCQTYKNRPIYWFFSSGKEKAFQAIVYLHRYNEGTLSRMRTEYVLSLQTRISRQIEHLEKDRDAVSGSAVNKIQREIIVLRRQQAELLKFDELLRHYADKKIMLDLDDGVKVNYAKFGDLLADVKKISGVKEGEDAATD